MSGERWSSQRLRLDLPDLPGLEQSERLRIDPCLDPSRMQRALGRIDRLIGQLERAVVMTERAFGAAGLKRPHGLGRVHVLVAHEPARLIGADRQDREPEWAVTVARGAEMMPVAPA